MRAKLQKGGSWCIRRGREQRRQKEQRKNESRWRSGSKGTNVTGGGGKWPIREQAISLADE